jgi:HNH endonuclease
MMDRSAKWRSASNETIRLYSKVYYTTTELACVEFTGYLDANGYGRIYWRGRHGYLAHRAAYELKYGPIPPGLAIDHTCNNRACIRYEHLEAVTQAENSRRAAERRTHCGNGHEWTVANTYWHQRGRNCRTCNRLSSRRYYERKHTQASASTGAARPK